MPWLQFYEKERAMFPEAFQKTVTDHQAVLVVSKLNRHFRILSQRIQVDFYGTRAAHAYWRSVTLPHNPSIGHICHELAHIFNRIKYGISKHNKKLMHTIKRFINYCQKQNYWRDEFAKREQLKQTRPQPTKKDLLQKKLAKVQKHIKRTQTRIKRLNTSLKKWKQKEKYYQKQLSFLGESCVGSKEMDGESEQTKTQNHSRVERGHT